MAIFVLTKFSDFESVAEAMGDPNGVLYVSDSTNSHSQICMIYDSATFISNTTGWMIGVSEADITTAFPDSKRVSVLAAYQ